MILKKSVASTTQRRGIESEFPVKEVSKLYPNVSAKNITIPLQSASLQSCRSKQNAQSCSSEKSSKSLRQDNGTFLKLPSKPAPKNTCVSENNNHTTQKSGKLREHKKSEPEVSSQSMQNQSSKVENNKPADTVNKALNPVSIETEPGFSTKPAQSQSNKDERKEFLNYHAN